MVISQWDRDRKLFKIIKNKNKKKTCIGKLEFALEIKFSAWSCVFPLAFDFSKTEKKPQKKICMEKRRLDCI